MDRNYQPLDIHQKVVELIDGGSSFAVALVLKAEGSTPRKAGVKAIIEQTGNIWGTLGGGAVEAETQRRAVEACQLKRPIVFDFYLHGTSRKDEVPICGGSMRILIDPTVEKNRASYAQAAEAIQRRQRGVLLTTICTTAQADVTMQWLPEQDVPSGSAFPGVRDISSCLASEEPQLFTESLQKPDAFIEVLVEPVIPKPLLLIAGAGHIGQMLALQAVLIGFDVVVMDDRPEFTDQALFPEGVTTLCGDIPKEMADFPIADDTYIVVVTHGHKLDAAALEACIHSPATYIGMIGSKRKVALLRRSFVESGLATEEEFDRVFAPIGLDIDAVTVPEIATSITAQLIAVRRKGRTHTPPGDMEPR
jgi:xanthine dehydrogenase accessory factor